MGRRVAGLAALAVLVIAPCARAGDPPAQFTVEQLQRDLAKTGAGPSCEDQGLVEGDNGQCEERMANMRGFSLPGAAPGHGAASAPGAKSAVKRTHAKVSPPHGRDLLITFDNNSSSLTPQARSNAKVFAEAIRSPELASMRFEIAGHTNATGSREMNLALSQRRAQALVDYLQGLGVDPSRLQPRGYGFEQPIDPADPRAPRNRRVEARRLS
jgi:outer membrane protein OmpA-like peptidoglycan-associated protein